MAISSLNGILMVDLGCRRVYAFEQEAVMPGTQTLDIGPVRRAHKAEYYREWYARKGRVRTDEGREAVALWNKAHPRSPRCRAIVRYSLKAGKLIKPKECEKCEKERRLLAHHDDYNFPLRIRWLCYSCHQKHHNGVYDDA